MPGNYAEDSTQHSEHGKSLKSSGDSFVVNEIFVCMGTHLSNRLIFCFAIFVFIPAKTKV
jgi:hypothetical protein